MIFLGIQTFRNRNRADNLFACSRQESLFAGFRTTAANPGFILWWLTIGTALILNAKQFGLLGFSIFAGVHWLCDFVWYTLVAFVIFKSHRFWTSRVRQVVSFFCIAVFVGFGAMFFSSALWQAIIALV